MGKTRKASKELIGLASAALVQSSGTIVGGATNDLTVTIFDTTTRHDAARFLLTNSTGNARVLLDVGIKGKPVYRLSGAEGMIHDDFIDYESVEKNGEIKLEIDNDFIVTKEQVEKIADYWHKEGRQRKHYYELTLAGTQYNFEVAEWYTLDLNYTLMGKDEFIDSLVSIEAISVERTFDGIGTTSLILKEEEANWVFDANSPARFLSKGSHNRETRSDIITVGASAYIGSADYLCDGTADNIEIQLAIDVMATRNGGIVRLTEGQFNITATLTMYDNVGLEGSGWNTVIEKNMNDVGIKIDTKDGVRLRNFKITRNSADTNEQDLIYCDTATNLIIEKLHVTDTYGNGIYLTECSDFIIMNNKINICGNQAGNIKNGILCLNAAIGSAASVIAKNIIHDNYDSGIEIREIKDAIIEGNIVYQNTLNGIYINAAESCTLANNILYNGGHKMGPLLSVSGDGIFIASNSKNNLITGNVVRNNMRYGIRIDGPTSTDNTLTNNTCLNNGNLLHHTNMENVASAPHISGDGVSTALCTFVQSDTEAYAGTYSYLMTKTSAAAAGDAEARFNNNDNTNDLHELIVGITYQLTCWVYIPSTGGPDAAEVTLEFYEYHTGTWNAHTATAVGQDAWEQLDSGEFTLNVGATGVDLHVKIDTGAAVNELIYVDNVRLHEVGITNQFRWNFSDSGTRTHLH